MPIIVGSPGGGAGGQAPLTFLDLQNEVLAHGFDAGRYRERVKRWLNEGLHRIARTLRVDADTAEITTVGGQASVDLPNSVGRIESLYDANRRMNLANISAQDYDQSPSATPGGAPVAFMVSNRKLYLAPTPDRAYNLVLRFWSNPPDFVSDDDGFEGLGLPIDLNDYPMVLVSWALSRAFRAEDDAEMSRFYRTEFDADLAVMRGDLQLPVRGVPRQIGGPAGPRGPRFLLPGR